MEHESHHHHHPHGTGTRWLDITLGVAATIVSLVSLWLGLHSAHSMEKLVASNSYPYVELMRSSYSQDFKPGTDSKWRIVEYDLVNNGVGPARIEWVEFRYKGKPVKDITELLDACCKAQAYDYSGLNRRGGIAGALVRPGTMVSLFTWTERAKPSPAFEALRSQMDNIDWSACYCSVFDECYVRKVSQEGKPEPVKQCVAPPVTFRPAYREDK